jgi:DNA topoisomerase-3
MLPETWKLTVLPSSKQQFEGVARLLNRSDVGMIINAADAGREGELIFRLVYQHAGCNKPFQRLWISSMTDEAIKKGFEDLRPGEKYDPLARAALCRSRADWLVGMNFTRAYTRKLNSMFTVGRVQTPTLAMVVRRHLEIQNFVPRDYWEVSASMADFTALWFNPDADEYPSRIDSIEKAMELADRVKGLDATVHSAKKTAKKQAPPSLYDLTTLQREANSRFSMTAADTLSVLQNLYEKKKVVTYPRTDSRYLSDDIFPTIEKRLAALPGDYDEYLDWLRQHRPKKDKKIFNNAKVSDHHAVIPTEKKVTDTSTWTTAEKNIYDMVVRRFLAVFYPDHQYLSTTIIIKADGEHFKATGKVVTDEGWRVLYPRRQQPEKSTEPGEDEENDQSLPDLKKGDSRTITDTTMLTRKTKPPAAYTESTLLQAMETAGKLVESEELREAMKDGGLGTPATRAEIIEKLIKVEYMLRDKKKLVPTPKGIQLVTLAAPEITSPELTGNWEKRLADISRSKDNDDDFMKGISSFVCNIVEQVKCSSVLKAAALPQQHRSFSAGSDNRPATSPATVVCQQPASAVIRPVIAPCPACAIGGIIEGSRGFGCNRFKEGCNYVVWKEFYGKKISQAAIDSLIAGKPTRLIKGFKLEDGRVVSGKLQMKADHSGVELVIAEEVDSGKSRQAD